MDRIEEFVDERLKSWCIQCGAWIGGIETNEDHVPSKALLLKPHPDNLPVVRICTACNNGFSADEEYLFLFLRCVLAGTTDPDRHTDARVARALTHHDKLANRIKRSKMEWQTVDGETRYVWKPETARIHRVVTKNARGHAFYECGQPMLDEPEHVWAVPLEALTMTERKAFEDGERKGMRVGWPEVNSRMMTRVVTGQDLCNGWVVVQDGVYRYCVEQYGSMRVRTVLFEYLATEVYWNDC